MADARRLATRFVSIALVAVGVLFGAGGVFLLSRGGAGGVAAGVFALLVAVAALLAGFFFLLVPHRLESLREMQAEYEAEHGPYKPD